jgi:hypothetical protein
MGRFKKFLEMIIQLSCLTLEITLDDCYIHLVGVVHSLSSSLPLVATVTRQEHHFYPFLPPLAPFLAPLTVALDGVARLPPAAAFPSPKIKAAPTASSLAVCRVAISSSSLVVFG